MALFIQSNNPAATCPEQSLVRRGLARDDLFTVVHDTFLSDTARYADIVLPACTSYESEDLYRGYGTYYVQYGAQVLPPQGEAWPNYRLVAALAQRLGLHDPVFTRIEFHVDIDARKARLMVPGMIEAHGEPILNPVTKKEHRVRIDMVNGFEYKLAEVGRGWAKTTKPIKLENSDSYGQFAHIHLSNMGIVH